MVVKNEREYMKIAKNMVCLMLVLTGIYLCLSEFINLKIHPVILLCYMVGMVLVLLLLEEKRSWRKYVLEVLAVIVFLEIAGSWRQHQQGFLGCLNQVLDMLNQYYGIELKHIPWSEYPQVKVDFFGFFFIVIGSMESIIWHFSRKKRGFVNRLLLPVILVIGIMLAGKIPSFAGVLLLLAGTAVGKLKLGHRGAYGALAGIVLVLGIASVFAHSEKAENVILKLHNPLQEKQWEAEEAVWNYIQRFLLGKQDKRQEEIQLGNHKPEQNGRLLFKITLSRAPVESIYLRGFVGGIYQNGSWHAVPQETFRGFAENAGYEVVDYAQFLAKHPYEWGAKISSNPLELNIKMAEEPTNYVLVPYFSVPSEQVVLSDDGTANPLQQKEYNWKGYINEYSSSKVMQGIYFRDSGTQTPWNAYQRYVNANYKTVPEDLNQLAEFAKQQVNGKENPIERIPELLAQQAEYSLNLEPLPEDSEFTVDFMFRQKKGYCVHFATAGTLLLRMSGIPARYVSGYCVKPEDFMKNQDGTYTAVVTDKRAHAWSEVFHEEIGFYPVEMTPAAATEGVEIPGQEPVVNNQKEPEKKEATEQKPLEKFQKEAEKENIDKKEAEKENIDKKGANMREPAGKVNTVLWKAAQIAVLVILLLTVMVAFRRKRIKNRIKRLRQEDRSKAVLEIGKEVFRLLEISGFRKEKYMTEQSYALMLQEKIPLEKVQSWHHFVGILQKAAFSGKMLSDLEWQEAWNLYQSLNEWLDSQKNKWQRFWWRYI